MPKKIRQIRVEGNIAYVPLTQGFEAVVDKSDIPLIELANWHVRKDSSNNYAARNLPKDKNGRRGAISMHRVIMGIPTDFEVDHIDGNGLNNRKENLRLVSRSQNQSNRKVSSLSLSGLKGVSPYRRNGTWHARISVNGKRICLGYYKTPEAAHAAYCEASQKFHGIYGRIE